jgi:hypothetical protein
MTATDSALQPAPDSGSAAHRARLWLAAHGWLAAVIGIALFGAIANAWAWGDYVFEDAYITYRYASNVAQGHGFVFNPGERVFGTTTPLYTLLLALLAWLGLPIPETSETIYALGLAVTGVLGALMLRSLGSPRVGLVFATYMAWAALVMPNHWGLETSLYNSLLFGTLYAAWRRAPTWTGVLMGLAFLTRYDAFVFVAVLLLVMLWRDRRIPWRTGLVALAVVSPWLLFAQLYFGSVLPNTLASKAGSASSVLYAFDSVAAQIRFQGMTLLRLGVGYAPARLVASGLVLAVLCGLFCGTRRLLRRQPLMAQVAIYPIALWIGYAIIAPPVNHHWYLVPATIFVIFWTLAGWGLLAEEWTSRLRAPWPTAIFAALVLGALALVPSTQRRDSVQRQSGAQYRNRINAYQAMAQRVNDYGLSGLSILTREPGYLGLLTGNPMIDGAGLITEELRYHQGGGGRTPFDEILARFRPDLIVLQIHGWDLQQPVDYLPLLETETGRNLVIRQEALAEHYSDLSRRWLERVDAAQLEPGVLAQHPLRADFEVRAASSPWDGAAWAKRSTVGARPIGSDASVSYAGAPVPGSYLMTRARDQPRGTVTSPPFLVDFDRLTLRFAGTNTEDTSVCLVVDGLIVLCEYGTGLTELRDVSWPVAAWHGESGFLQLRDNTPTGFAVLDEVRSVVDRRVRLLDDFERGRYDAIWRYQFGRNPSSLESVVVEHGLGLQVGSFGAISQDLEGEQHLSTYPFVVDRSRISFLVFDFGDRRTRVSLRVDGTAKRQFLGGNSQRLVAITWELDELLGQDAVLSISDEAPEESIWIGIDEVRLFDPGD